MISQRSLRRGLRILALITLSTSKSIYQSRDAIFQPINVKINQQAQPLSSKLEVREKLGLVNWQNSFNCLEFDNNFILDEKIQPISKVNAHSILAHRQRELRFDTQPPFPQLMSKANLVRALEKTRPKNGMNSHGRINNLPADRVEPFSFFLSDLSANCLRGLCVDHLVRPESICSFSPAAAWAAASRAVSTRNGEQDT